MTRFLTPSHGRGAMPSVHRLFDPVDTWSNWRVALTGLTVWLLVFVAGAFLWHASDLSGTEAARSAFDDAQRRLDRARTVIEQLPSMRARLSEDLPASRWTVADALHQTTALAAQSGLRIGTVEPSLQKGEGLEIERPLRFRAEGSFGAIRRFMVALEGLPRLVVPADVQMKRGANGLELEATLRVFEALPPVARPAPAPKDTLAIDPFGARNGVGAGGQGVMTLVGTLRGRHRAMALVETAEGVDAFAPGEMIGAERLGSIRSGSIDLARRDGVMRTVAFAEDRP